MILRVLPLFALALAAAQAPKYNGPVPPQPDLPYLKHASNLVATEPVEIKEEKDKTDSLFTIAGEASSAKTPLGLPVLLLKAEKLDPLKLVMFRLTVKDGRREITASGKKTADPIRVVVTRVSDGLFRLEVYDSLENGEYMLAADGSNQAFCFEID